ncbi:MAG: hypothetical protein GEU28_02235 [Dehalococcoidia bacterium]|nr:hypothetical protein [Dehalococcoidia bacterium]
MRNRRSWLTFSGSLILLVGLLAAACGDDDDDDDADSNDVTPTGGGGEEVTDVTVEEEATEEGDESGAEGRQDGGSVALHSLEPAGFDPHAANSAEEISFARMVWRAPYSLTADNEVVFEDNGIASALPEVSGDGLSVSIPINEGLSWSDGDDLTADDFVAGIKRTCNPNNTGYYAYLFSDIAPVVGCGDLLNAFFDDEGNEVDPATVDLAALESAMGVSAPDPQTVEIQLAAPSPTLPIILTLWVAFPVPTHLDQFASAGPGEFAEWGIDPAALAYNGPYVWNSYSAQDSIVLSPNENWTGSIQPTLEEITLRLLDNPAAANNAYRTDELDFALADATQLQQLELEFGDEYLQVMVPATEGLTLQMEDEVLSDLNVRLALSKAIDRNTLNEVVALGGNAPTTSWVPEEVSGVPLGSYDEVLGYDPDGAVAALDEAGYPGGEGFPTLSLLVPPSPLGQATGEFLQGNFSDVLGIEIAIEPVDGPTAGARFNGGDFDMIPYGWIGDYPDIENWIVGLFNTGGGNNQRNCSMPEVDELIEQAILEPDNGERAGQYREVERLVLENACGVLPYWHETNKYLISSRLVGFAENATGQDSVIAGDWRAEAWGLAAE